MSATTTSPATETDHVYRIQGLLLDIPVGMTRVIHGVAVTRWNDEEFEVGTWGRPANTCGSEQAAERIAAMKERADVRLDAEIAAVEAMTDDEVLASIRAEGRDPAEVAASVRVTIEAAIAEHESKARQRLPAEPHPKPLKGPLP